MNDGLKQRLVGAVVLVAVGILFLPGLLDRDSRRSIDLSSQIPPEPQPAPQLFTVAEPQRPENIPPAKALEDNYAHQPVEAKAEPAADDIPVDDIPVNNSPVNDVPVNNSPVAENPPAEVAPAPAAPPELNAQGVPDAWSLQVASFQSDERARALLKELQHAGYKSYVRAADTAQGRVNRVFVGPKVNKADLQREKRAIDKRFRTDALVVEFKP